METNEQKDEIIYRQRDFISSQADEIEKLKSGRTKIFCSEIVFIAILIIAGHVIYSKLKKYHFTKNCDSFSTQQEAQDALSDYPNLDNNHDGTACNDKK